MYRVTPGHANTRMASREAKQNSPAVPTFATRVLREARVTPVPLVLRVPIRIILRVAQTPIRDRGPIPPRPLQPPLITTGAILRRDQGAAAEAQVLHVQEEAAAEVPAEEDANSEIATEPDYHEKSTSDHWSFHSASAVAWSNY